MNSGIELRRLTIENFADFEALGACDTHPEYSRDSLLQKVRSGSHVGALAYRGAELVGWVSLGPLVDFHGTWRRVAQIGEKARSIAGVLGITLAEKHRGAGRAVLGALEAYARTQGWTAIEGYPFEAHEPGLAQGYLDAGFTRVGPHWLNRPEAERSIYSLHVAAASAVRRTA